MSRRASTDCSALREPGGSSVWLTGPAVAALLLAACEPGASSPSGALVRDSAGVQIVENGAPAWRSEDAWRVGETPSLEIGAIEAAEPAYEFSRITGLVRLSDGRIVVLDDVGSQLRFFDAMGRHEATRGGRGGGPSEFAYAIGMVRLAGDTIMVADRRHSKHVYFTAGGEFVRSERLDGDRFASLGPWAECGGRLLPDLSLLLCRPEPGHARQDGEPRPGYHRDVARFVAVPLTLDTVVPLGRYGGPEQWMLTVGGRPTFASHPFHAHTVVAVGGSPLRIAMAFNPAYSVELWTPAGELERVVRRSGARRAASAEERAAALERVTVGFSDDESLRRTAVAQMTAPDSLPAVLSLHIDAANHLWVERAVALQPAARVFDVFDPGGALLGEVAMPLDFTAYEIGSDYVLGVYRDELDVPFVRLYPLERGEPAARVSASDNAARRG